MPVTSPFWAAFYTGLAAPVALYSAAPSFEAYTTILQPSQCFAIAGAYMTQAAAQVIDDRRYDAERAA